MCDGQIFKTRKGERLMLVGVVESKPYARELWECKTHRQCQHCDVKKLGVESLSGYLLVGYCQQAHEYVEPDDQACSDWEGW